MSRTHPQPNGPPGELATATTTATTAIAAAAAAHTTPSSDLAKWKEILDSERKGFISNRDLHHALYACGLEPTVAEMARITDPAHISDRAARSLELFAALGVSVTTATNLILYYRREGYQLRPDGFS